MKRFILCDLHIGHRESRSDVILEAVKFVRDHPEQGDEVLGLGDWFHLEEEGIEKCKNNSVTQELIHLAEDMPVRLIPGNHDIELKKKYRTDFSPIVIIEPFKENGIWYRHGHEFDWLWKYVPSWLRKIAGWITGNKTPGALKGEKPDSTYLMSCHLIHSKAVSKLQKAAEKNNEIFKGIVLGHTHLPLQQECHQMPFQLNGGDMRDSLTFIVQDTHELRLLYWDGTHWEVMSRQEI
jgi:UDP-2,3-diacylglucosamine pyrophosphatase LpxH